MPSMCMPRVVRQPVLTIRANPSANICLRTLCRSRCARNPARWPACAQAPHTPSARLTRRPKAAGCLPIHPPPPASAPWPATPAAAAWRAAACMTTTATPAAPGTKRLHRPVQNQPAGRRPDRIDVVCPTAASAYRRGCGPEIAARVSAPPADAATGVARPARHRRAGPATIAPPRPAAWADEMRHLRYQPSLTEPWTDSTAMPATRTKQCWPGCLRLS